MGRLEIERKEQSFYPEVLRDFRWLSLERFPDLAPGTLKTPGAGEGCGEACFHGLENWVTEGAQA